MRGPAKYEAEALDAATIGDFAIEAMANPRKTDLQTIIVSKDRASTRKQAEKIADKHAKRAIYTSRETGRSWRFRQRPPGDFVKTSFRTVKVDPGVSLVFGTLKRGKKPMTGRRRKNPIERAKAKTSPLKKADEIIFLHRLPDPGDMSWLYEATEIRWIDPKSVDPIHGLDEYTWTPDEGEYWMMLWSPSLRAILVLREPESMQPAPVTNSKAREIYERFSEFPAEHAHRIKVPKYENLKLLGKPVHIVYRSDKFDKVERDYIHDSEDAVMLFADNKKAPNIFIFAGGKLDVTERGIIY